jgi:uncharacterized membrane protein
MANNYGEPVRKTSVNLPEDLYELMARAAESVGVSPTQFIREAILLRVGVAGGEVTDELRRMADEIIGRRSE